MAAHSPSRSVLPNRAKVLDDGVIIFGSDEGVFLEPDTTQTNDAVVLWLGSDMSRTLIIAENAARGDDYALAAQANPTLVIFSVTRASVATDQYLLLQHNATDAIVRVGSGGLRLQPNNDTDDYFLFETLTNVPTLSGTGAYVRIGTAAFTSQALDSPNDLLVSGELEVDGTFFADGGIASGVPVNTTVSNAVTNAVTTVLNLVHNTTGVPANNLGTGLDFSVETSTTAGQLAASIDVIWTDITHGTRTSDMIFYATVSTTETEFFRLDGSAGLNGLVQLNRPVFLTNTTVFTNPTSPFRGADIRLALAITSGANSGQYRAIIGLMNPDSSWSSSNLTDTVGAGGVQGDVSTEDVAGGAAYTITGAASGVFGYGSQNGANVTVTNWYGVYIGQMASNTGTITNNYGILVVDMTVGGTTNVSIALGTAGNIAIHHRVATLLANTALGGVLIGTPVSPAGTANSLLISNTTASGNILVAVNNGGNSQAVLQAVGASGSLILFNAGVGVLWTGVNLVGIGTSTPQSLLSVAAGTGNVGGQVQIGGNTSVLGTLLTYEAVLSGVVNLVSLNNSGGADARINFGFGVIASNVPTLTVLTLNQLGNMLFGAAATISTAAGTSLTLNALTTGSVILQSGGTVMFTANNTGVGLYTATPVARAAAIAAPAGGATIDAESRTAINSIRDAIRLIGITS